MDCISKRRTYLREVKPHLICLLCRGYLIDATTIVECLHSFCRSCILKHLRTKAQCPQCNQLVNTAKPNIKADKTLQDIVYKLVPGLYHKEMKRRREFYSKHPDGGYMASVYRLGYADAATPEQRGEDVSGRLIFAPEDAISLSLEYLPVSADPLAYMSGTTADNDNESTKSDSSSSSSSASNSSATTNAMKNENQDSNSSSSGCTSTNAGINNSSRRYLQCPALVTIAHLKKFLALKYSVDVTRFNIDICHRRASLPDHWTLMDVAYIFAWKRNAPIRFFYRITQEILEAPSNDRPSTPGLGASQPPTPPTIGEKLTADLPCKDASKTEILESVKKLTTEQETIMTKPIPKLNPLQDFPVNGNNQGKHSPAVTNPSKETNAKSSPPDLIRAEDALKQVKSPIKIMKNSEGRYQVLRTSQVNGNTGHKSPKSNGAGEQRSPNRVSPHLEQSQKSPKQSANSADQKATPEFSVVSIGDGASNNGGVKITLKQLTPGSNSKKPKVISDLLIKNPIIEEKKRKSIGNDDTLPLKQYRKPAGDEKKSFLHSFRLAAKSGEAKDANKPKDINNASLEPSVEEQVRNIIRNSEANRNLKNVLDDPSVDSKKRQSEVKTTSTNIADRLGSPKVAPDTNSPISSTTNKKPQDPIDVYNFPSDPPSTIMPGAVKRKCPPALPIYEGRKKQALGVNTKRPVTNNVTKAKGVFTNFKKPVATSDGGMTQDKMGIRDQLLTCEMPPPMSSKPLQSLPVPMGNVEATITPVSSPAHTRNIGSNSAIMSDDAKRQNDSRNLLNGCGLNIPASLSITLTDGRSPNHESSDNNVVAPNVQNTRISLNEKSVDPLVLKALKSGQIRMTPTNSIKRPTDSQDKETKKVKCIKKEPNQIPIPPPNFKAHPLKIPSPGNKTKRKSPANWPLPIVPKPSKDEAQMYARGQVVTLNSGQRFYRAAPGSLTPAVHRLGDIPTSTRTPVYTPLFSSPCSSPRPMQSMPNLPNVYSSLQALYPINQHATFESFNMPNTQIRLVPPNDSPHQTPTKSHIVAQCPPVKPSRASGSFVVPVAKPPSGLTIRSVNSKPVPRKQPTLYKPNDSASNESKSETASSTQTKIGNAVTKEKNEKEECKEATPSKGNTEHFDKCPTSSTSEQENRQQGSDSPRVSSTASPSPPLVLEIPSNDAKVTSEESAIINAPASPDSSSVVSEDTSKTNNLKDEEVVIIKETKAKVDSEKLNDGAKKEEQSAHQRFINIFPPHMRKDIASDSDHSKAIEDFDNYLKSLSVTTKN